MIWDTHIDGSSPHVAHDDAHAGTGKVLGELVEDGVRCAQKEPVSVEVSIEPRGHGIREVRHAVRRAQRQEL